MATEQPRKRKSWIGIKAVCRRLDCSDRTVERLVEERRLIRPRMMGGQRRWHHKDIAVYLWRVLRGDFDDDQPPKKSTTRRGKTTTRNDNEVQDADN